MLLSASDTTLRLVADVGGTNARFGLLRGARGTPELERTLPTAAYPGIDAAIDDYLRQAGAGRPVDTALAIANPETGDTIKMSNCPWTYSIQDMRVRLGLDRLLGARGGLYVGGGIVPRIADYFAGSRFRASFEAKDRLAPYLAAVPTWLIRAANPALLGAAMAPGVVPEPAHAWRGAATSTGGDHGWQEHPVPDGRFRGRL